MQIEDRLHGEIGKPSAVWKDRIYQMVAQKIVWHKKSMDDKFLPNIPLRWLGVCAWSEARRNEELDRGSLVPSESKDSFMVPNRNIARSVKNMAVRQIGW